MAQMAKFLRRYFKYANNRVGKNKPGRINPKFRQKINAAKSYYNRWES